jgi:diadenosine tetraphosphatase ApaH/serine/threonine PP2A family protein phosphatase
MWRLWEDVLSLIAIFADIHANRPAFEACLRDAAGQGAGDIVLLGDYVGYGADPEWTVETVTDLVAKGAIAVRGNHDTAVGDPTISLNIEAQVAMEWTRGELGKPQREFLARLPASVPAGEVLYVHADARAPEAWNYLIDAAQAAKSLLASPARITFCGHTHVPAVYSMSPTGKMTAFTPVDDVHIDLLPARRWLIVAGSVGQPRDGRAAACWLKFDPQRMSVTFRRVPYDVDLAAARIREKRLPSWLADRLYLGR